MPSWPSYVLVTPARDEAEFIERTIKSVVSQSVRPLKWVIVSDGSTDGTDEIVSRYAAANPWIELLRMPERKERHFAGKVHAFNAGYSRLNVDYDAIGLLDADISFEEDYFSFLLQKMTEDPALGVVGTPFRDPTNETYNYRFVGLEHVTGCCQLFRRQCYQDIGGYTPAKGGAVDRIAVIAARMKGWKTRTFTDKWYLHHRTFGTAERGILGSRFRDGAKDYAVGSHPVFELCRTAYQMTKAPWVVGGLMLLCGYLWSSIRRADRPVSPELVKFHRREQMKRLRGFFAGQRVSTGE